MFRKQQVVGGWDWREYSIQNWEELIPFREEIRSKGLRRIEYRGKALTFFSSPFALLAFEIYPGGGEKTSIIGEKRMLITKVATLLGEDSHPFLASIGYSLEPLEDYQWCDEMEIYVDGVIYPSEKLKKIPEAVDKIKERGHHRVFWKGICIEFSSPPFRLRRVNHPAKEREKVEILVKEIASVLEMKPFLILSQIPN